MRSTSNTASTFRRTRRLPRAGKDSSTLPLVLSALGVGLGLLSFIPAAPALVWNVSPSLPLGLYIRTGAPWRKTDIVAVRPSTDLRRVLHAHAALPPGRLLIKTVAASAGDIVCRDGATISINGVASAQAVRRPAGSGLPRWQGCRRLSSDDVFLLGGHPASFDGRYFGPTKASDVIGVLHPLWLLETAGGPA